MALLAASAPQLRSLEHNYPCISPENPASALPAELGRLSQLTSLSLGFGSALVSTEQVDAMVQTLPLLQHLVLNGQYASSLLGGFPVSIATSCSRLEHLTIQSFRHLGNLPPQLGLLTALTGLDLSDCAVTSLPETISRLTALKELKLSHSRGVVEVPPRMTACQQLTKVVMGDTSTSPVLGRLHSLRSLAVNLRTNEPPHELYWAHLSAFNDLELRCIEDGSLPAGLGSMVGLRVLTIGGAVLDDLPTGPYLNQLETLSMDHCTFNAGVPASLAAAKKLQYLGLGVGSRGIDLTAADGTVLFSLPERARVFLCKPNHMDYKEWGKRIAQLKAQSSEGGRVPLKIYNF